MNDASIKHFAYKKHHHVHKQLLVNETHYLYNFSDFFGVQ